MYYVSLDQKERLKELLEDADRLLAQKDFRTFLAMLDDEIMRTLKEDPKDTYKRNALTHLYYEIFHQNK